MTCDDRLWLLRVQDLFGPLYRAWIEPRGFGRWLWRFRVYGVALHVHRWFWVRGVGL